MVKSFIYRFIARRHFWRHATFSEVAQLYASRLMRLFALRIISVFTSIYLYQEGYSLAFIAFFWAGFYVLKVIFATPVAMLIAKRGPKHGTLVSNIISTVAMVLLPFVTDTTTGFYVLVGWCALQAFSGALNDLSYLVDFSKVKSMRHAGKEIGFMNIFEKIATGLSPFIGGLVAFWLGPHAVMIISAALFMLSTVPLLLTAEPIKINMKLNFSKFPWRSTWRSCVSETAIGMDVFTTGNAWSLFLVVVVFAVSSNKVYAEVGFVASAALLVTFVSSYVYGRLIDSSKGGELMRFGVITNSFVHLGRLFVSTPMGVVLLNVINEMSTTGYYMPFIRGMFDLADRSDKRVEYLYIIEMAVNFGAFVAAIILGTLFVYLSPVAALNSFFVVIAVFTLLIATPRFALYRR